MIIKHKFSAHLTDRAVLRISGEDALTFLSGLFTSSISAQGLGFGALLSPQGKILFDFIAHSGENIIYLDCAQSIVADFMKRLGFYKLRAKVALEIAHELTVYAEWGDVEPNDPRLPSLGRRFIAPIHASGNDDYHAHRNAQGVPEGGRDFGFGEAFPHEVLMDQLHGVDFKKGCYVGQEVVSRMEHRGTARTRMMQVAFDTPFAFDLPAPVISGGKSVGELRSVSGLTGLALVRIDKLVAGQDVNVLGQAVRIQKPEFARFEYPVVEKRS